MSHLPTGARETLHRCPGAGLLAEPPKPLVHCEIPRLWLLGEREASSPLDDTATSSSAPVSTARALAVPGLQQWLGLAQGYGHQMIAAFMRSPYPSQAAVLLAAGSAG